MDTVDITHMTEDWRIFIISFSVLLTAIIGIIRYGLIPFGKAVWKAVVAAPQIATGIGHLVDLLEEANLPDRIKVIEASVEKIESTQQDVVHLKKTLSVLEERVLLLEKALLKQVDG